MKAITASVIDGQIQYLGEKFIQNEKHTKKMK